MAAGQPQSHSFGTGEAVELNNALRWVVKERRGGYLEVEVKGDVT
jgi:hypothetical protein